MTTHSSVASVEASTAPPAAQSFEELTQRNIETIMQMEQAMLADRKPADRMADAIATFCGSMAFVWVHLVWFIAWALLNTVAPWRHIDTFPFPLLTLLNSLEAIFLTTFILISQNHQGRAAERRNHLELQINLLTEQENSKMLAMLSAIMQHMKIEHADEEIELLKERTLPDKLAQQIGATIETPETRGQADTKSPVD